MIFVALSESADKGELLLVDGGMCRYHRRKDGIHTIREILILPQFRRKGVGTKLVLEVMGRADGRPIKARCPVKYVEANLFWRAMGFALLEERDGINLWQRPAQG